MCILHISCLQRYKSFFFCAPDSFSCVLDQSAQTKIASLLEKNHVFHASQSQKRDRLEHQMWRNSEWSKGSRKNHLMSVIIVVINCFGSADIVLCLFTRNAFEYMAK